MPCVNLWPHETGQIILPKLGQYKAIVPSKEASDSFVRISKDQSVPMHKPRFSCLDLGKKLTTLMKPGVLEWIHPKGKHDPVRQHLVPAMLG